MAATADDIARKCLRPIRGCATDDQYRDALARVTSAIEQAAGGSMLAGIGSDELVRLEGEDIVIRITPATLKFASENGVLCTFSAHANRFRRATVVDAAAWRDAVVRALRREAENGDTPVHLLLDAALEHAAEQGEEGIEIEGLLP